MAAVVHEPLAPVLALRALRELWIHTGTACNLSCAFCHEGSQPGDRRLEPVGARELAPMLQHAAAAGVERFIFTGGEPLTARDILAMLELALALRPALVLTNGTAPLIRRSLQLAHLAARPHPLAFRVSIDHPDESRHDAGRGPKNFRRALQGLKLLHQAGFAVSVACQVDRELGPSGMAQRFAALFARHGLPPDIALVQLPELGRPGAVGSLPSAGPFHDARLAGAACCTRGRMLLRRDGALRLHACPLTDDDLRFDVGPDLQAAMASSVMPRHRRCATCLSEGVSYSG